MKKSAITFTTAVDNPDMGGVRDIDAKELSQKAKDVHLIDVRRDDEYVGELGHIASSKLIVLDTIPNRLSEFPPKDEPIVLICRSGARSARAAAYLASQGYQHVYNMQGGMLRWNELGLPIEK